MKDNTEQPNGGKTIVELVTARKGRTTETAENTPEPFTVTLDEEQLHHLLGAPQEGLSLPVSFLKRLEMELDLASLADHGGQPPEHAWFWWTREKIRVMAEILTAYDAHCDGGSNE
jgi:hypothetical protein